MATIDHNGKSYNVDEDGFLANGMEEWDENWVPSRSTHRRASTIWARSIEPCRRFASSIPR